MGRDEGAGRGASTSLHATSVFVKRRRVSAPGVTGPPAPPVEQMCSSLLPLRQGGRRLFVHANSITLTLLLFPILCQKEPHGIRRMF